MRYFQYSEPSPGSGYDFNQKSDPRSNQHRFRPQNDTQTRAQTQFQKFEELIGRESRSLQTRLVTELRQNEEHLRKADLEGWGLSSIEEFRQKFEKFDFKAQQAARRATRRGEVDEISNPLFCKLKDAYIGGDIKGLQAEINYAFTDSVLSNKFSPEELELQKSLADFRNPAEWYPATRAMRRTVHLHVGPTNSGKTYNALQRLEAAQSGIYAGPLRLLAHEVYTRLNAKGKACSLVTGEERRVPVDAKDLMKSCTVEMVPLNTKVDVAVIDEIQMIGDEDRGWAWTQAVLGVQAKELHLCGEVRTTDLIKQLCATTGDELIIHNYERLGKLEVMDQSLVGRHIRRGGDRLALNNLQKGDAIILFSRVQIHAMKNQIEKEYKDKRCAIVYGSLPPETRALQAALFNDPNNEYDFLVASNAIGMGLNLSIKRVILHAVERYNGTEIVPLPVSEIKQIAGRAGRFKTASDAAKVGPIDVTDGPPIKPGEPPVGYVTTFNQSDHKRLSHAMSREAAQLTSAGIFPPASVIERFSAFFPRTTKFSYILLRINDLCSRSPNFHLCKITHQIAIADIIQDFNLSIRDRLIFISAPIILRDPGVTEVARAFARCVADNSGGHILAIPEIQLDLLDRNIDECGLVWDTYVRSIETLHKIVTLYLWLSYRFTGVFYSQALAFHIKGLVEEKIEGILSKAQWRQQAQRMARRNAERARKGLERKNLLNHPVPEGFSVDKEGETVNEDKEETEIRQS